MKDAPFMAVALLLSSCVDKPSVDYVTVDGTPIRLRVGRVFLAKEGATVTEITGPGGIVIKHMSESIDATEVANNAIVTAGTLGTASIAGSVQKVKLRGDTTVATGAQKADVAKHVSDNALKEKTFVPSLPK